MRQMVCGGSSRRQIEDKLRIKHIIKTALDVLRLFIFQFPQETIQLNMTWSQNSINLTPG